MHAVDQLDSIVKIKAMSHNCLYSKVVYRFREVCILRLQKVRSIFTQVAFNYVHVSLCLSYLLIIPIIFYPVGYQTWWPEAQRAEWRLFTLQTGD